MTKKPTLQNLSDKIDRLTAGAEIQLRRIAQLQAELDATPRARRHRAQMLKAFVVTPLTRRDGNGTDG